MFCLRPKITSFWNTWLIYLLFFFLLSLVRFTGKPTLKENAGCLFRSAPGFNAYRVKSKESGLERNRLHYQAQQQFLPTLKEVLELEWLLQSSLNFVWDERAFIFRHTSVSEWGQPKKVTWSKVLLCSWGNPCKGSQPKAVYQQHFCHAGEGRLYEGEPGQHHSIHHTEFILHKTDDISSVPS